MQYKLLTNELVDSTYECITNTILPLTIYSDIARRAEIEKYTPEKLRSFIDDPLRLSLVAVDDTNTVVGFLFGVVDAHVIFINWIGIAEEHRHHGHMKDLWNTMELWCKHRAVHKVWCDTNQKNLPSIAFLQSVGMNNVSDLKNFWYGHDYFIWEKSV